MAEKELKDLLAKLHEELERTDSVSSETLSRVKELDADIRKLAGSEHEEDFMDSLVERTRTLKSQFAANHPEAERFLSQIVDLLARSGI